MRQRSSVHEQYFNIMLSCGMHLESGGMINAETDIAETSRVTDLWLCFPGEALKVSAERFADDPCYLPKREAVVQAARALLAAVTRLLILADMIDVMCLLQHVSAVSKRWLRFPRHCSHF